MEPLKLMVISQKASISESLAFTTTSSAEINGKMFSTSTEGQKGEEKQF